MGLNDVLTFSEFIIDNDGDEALFEMGLASLADSPFTSPRDVPSAVDSGGKPTKRQGPRGGKKPLRLRQQQLSEVENELQKRLLELKQAQEERERLQMRLKVLEVVLPIREQQAELLRQRRQVSDARRHLVHQHHEPHHPQHRPEVEITELHSSSSGGSSSNCFPQPAPAQRLAALTNKPSAAVAACAAFPPGSTSVRPFRQEVAYPLHNYSRTHALTAAEPSCCRGAPKGMEQSDTTYSIPRLSSAAPASVIRDVIASWSTWVREAAIVLHALDARPHDPGPPLCLSKLHDKLFRHFGELRLEYPLTCAQLACINVQTGQRDELPPESFWISAAQGLKLSPEQVRVCRAALELYRERAEKARQQRRGLVQQLAAALAALGAPSLVLHQTPGLMAWNGAQGELTVQVEDLTAQLYRNVAAEGHALEVAKDFMASLSLVQLARASVLSYPYFPDVVSLLTMAVALSPPAPATASSK